MEKNNNGPAQTGTHQVFNQPEALQGHNLYAGDNALKEAVIRFGGHWGEDDLQRYGEICGRPEWIERGFQANAHKPEFEPHDRVGNRIDQVNYHPAYHQLMQLAKSEGLHSSPWTHPQPGAHIVRAAKYYLHSQLESGHCCPVTMTFACLPALQKNPVVAANWLPKITAQSYDHSNRPYLEKPALTIGMGMTEKQGGSDVRSNTSQAQPTPGEAAGLYTIRGHKWFLSAPMCDGFLMLAQSAGGLSCFLVPRWRPDGSKNTIEIQRLKHKAGNVANASSEVELRDAVGWLVGNEGAGIKTIIEMVALTRFDCMIGSAAAQRQATLQAIYHAQHRSAFGKKLSAQPLMQNVLADLQLEVEGSLALSMRMAQALDHPGEVHQRHLLRLGAAVGKYWICKRTPNHNYEAMECLGGNGLIENFITARLYRDAPVNAIWEGSGNIQALDILRTKHKEPEVLDSWIDELTQSAGSDLCFDRALTHLKAELNKDNDMEYRARDIADQLALTMQAHLLIQGSPAPVADAFIQSRLHRHNSHSVGTIPLGANLELLIERGNPLSG
uniref:acyl-CoA dehydrogenase family protein n=1 Tax=Microbulbifer agarilyticus TaxID=260552 RepID=UPI000255B9B0|nr:acyl-CoA dehydrogenase family protein [Microbulbifer agarilyticus]